MWKLEGITGNLHRPVVEPLAINTRVTTCDGTLNTEWFHLCINFRVVTVVVIILSSLRPRRTELL